MIELCTVDEARQCLRLDYDSDGGPDDDWLAIWIPAVSQSIYRWLKDDWRAYVLEVDSDGETVLDSDDVPVPVLDSNDDPTPLAVVKAAALLELDRHYRFRSGEGDADVPVEEGHGYVLGKGATYLLVPLRKTSIA